MSRTPPAPGNAAADETRWQQHKWNLTNAAFAFAEVLAETTLHDRTHLTGLN